MTFDCSDKTFCENNARCFQDDSDWPTRFICMWFECVYGTRCQFNTNEFGLSLDGILGYHILPHPNLNHQPFIIKMSLVLTVIFLITGFINSILWMMTFKNKCVHEVVWGVYLLFSSIISLLTIDDIWIEVLISSSCTNEHHIKSIVFFISISFN